MSAPPATPNPPLAVRRPGLLTATLGVIVATALAAIANGIMIASGGKELIKDIMADAGLPGISDADLDVAARLAGHESLDAFVDTFSLRGYLLLVSGVALLVFGASMRKAATWARVLVTVSAVLALLFSIVVVADETTTTMAGLAMVTLLGAIVSIVLTWLPVNGRYAKALH